MHKFAGSCRSLEVVVVLLCCIHVKLLNVSSKTCLVKSLRSRSHHWGVELIQLPFVVLRFHDVELIVFERPPVPNFRQYSLRIIAERAIRPREERQSQALAVQQRSRPHRVVAGL